KRIALFDTLLETLDPDATVAVVAHEVGHYRRGHVVQSVALAIAHPRLPCWLLSLVPPAPRLSLALRGAPPSPHASPVVSAPLRAPVWSSALPAAPGGRARAGPPRPGPRHTEREPAPSAAHPRGPGAARARGRRRLWVAGPTTLPPPPLSVLPPSPPPPLAQR